MLYAFFRNQNVARFQTGNYKTHDIYYRVFVRVKLQSKNGLIVKNTRAPENGDTGCMGTPESRLSVSYLHSYPFGEHSAASRPHR